MKSRSFPSILLVLLVVLLAGIVQAQPVDTTFFKEHYTKMEIMIPMRDGVRLFTAIYVPKDTLTKHPTMMLRTPYSSGPYGIDRFPNRLPNTMTFYARRSYILVTQDVRGRFMSEGDFVDVRPYKPVKKDKTDTDESTDAYDTVEWLVRNVPGNNGKVGIKGTSYPAFYAWMATIDAHPAVKATSPQAPVSEWMGGDDFYHNGAFLVSHAFDFFSNFGWPRPQPAKRFPPRFRHTGPDGYASYLSMGATRNLNERFLHDSVQTWNDLSKNWMWNDFWKARSVRPHLKNLKPAVLVVGGWYDTENLWGALNSYASANTQNADNAISLVMGPWPHGWWDLAGLDSLGDIKFGSVTTQYYAEKIEVPFFEHHLNGAPDPSTAEASVFVTGTNEWRHLPVWPPTPRTARSLFLRENGSLAFDPPEQKQPEFDEYISDPAKPVPYTGKTTHWYDGSFMNEDQRFASRRPDVLIYRTEPLAEDVTLVGPIDASLFISTSGTDCDIIVKVIDVFPDTVRGRSSSGTPLGGYQMLVRGDVLRGKFRKSTTHPEPFASNTVTPASFRLQDAFHTFKKGHRIMVHVQSTWFPMIDRNPGRFMNIFEARDADYQKTVQRVYRSSIHPSAIRFSVMP